jgi:ferredoxin
MTYVICEPCIDVKDRACVEVCPVDAIHEEGDADRILTINPDECIDCGACEPACPVSAIYAEDDVPADVANFKAINAGWYSDKAAARAAVAAFKPS